MLTSLLLPSISRKHHCSYQCELAISRQGSDHPHRRREKDAGVERLGSRREGQDLRQGRGITSREGVYELLVSYRSGDMWAPKIEQAEALKVELQYFLDCIEKDETPMNDGVAGLRVIRLLKRQESR